MSTSTKIVLKEQSQEHISDGHNSNDINNINENSQIKKNINEINIHFMDTDRKPNTVLAPVSKEFKNVSREENTYPYSIVWSQLPCLSQIFPMIGHTGICSSSGIVHEFAGDHFIGLEHLSFGNPVKYFQFRDLTDKQKEIWDEAIEESDAHFKETKHNLFCNNCHHHCAYVLNKINYRKKKYNTCAIICLLCKEGKYFTKKDCFCVYLCNIIFFIIVILAIILCIVLLK